ncbi:MAG TPA: NUDIX domain-containing protein [Thermoanaerobaculia bacterium]|jgi:predicted NUDIX family NTP pyrophosphohydrolase|nr:NUDIX domain-containing protein [Thermoanaerobaculia bacterium]
MPKTSAGLLLYRLREGRLEVFLVHPGGPFWARKDLGAWSIPKGEFTEPEEPLAAAVREFREETGATIEGSFLPLSPRKQPGGKIVHAWAVEGELDPRQIQSNTFLLEWPRGSGRQKEFPEVDRAEWFGIPEAKRRILAGQLGFLDDLCERLGAPPAGVTDS